MKKTIKTILFFILCIVLFTTCVNAEDEACKITLSANKTTLKPGDEVTITLLMEDIAKSSGIVEFISALDFSEDVFDIIFEEDEELKADLGEENCEILYNGENDTDSSIKNPWYLIYIEQDGVVGIYGATGADPQVESQIVGKIKLRVKENVTTTGTTLSLLKTEVFDAENLDAQTGYTIADSEIKLQITGTSQSVTNPTTNTNTNSNTNNNRNSNSNSNTNSNGNSNTNRNKTQTENKANKDVPYAGIEDYAPFIILGIIISIMAYINYKKYKDI